MTDLNKMQSLLKGDHLYVLGQVGYIVDRVNLDLNVLPSADEVVEQLKQQFKVKDYVWENIKEYIQLRLRSKARSYHGLTSDISLAEWDNVDYKCYAVLYDSQCELSNIA